jgi:succinate dehydrogenase / fumarate reductase membrane anchor subunit
MSLESPLGRALGRGSAKEGSGHWIGQRITAIGLVPLGLWFLFSLLGLENTNYQFVAAWVADPANAILLILLLLTLLYHSLLGAQVVIEDYVHGAAKIISLLALRGVFAIMAVSGLFAVISVSARST